MCRSASTAAGLFQMGKGQAKDVATFGLPLFHPIFLSRLGTKLI